MARFPKYTPKQLEQFEGKAINELELLDPGSIKNVGNWWIKWYLKIGHRRLGRNLIRAFRNIPDMPPVNTARAAQENANRRKREVNDTPRVVGTAEKFVFSSAFLDSTAAFSFGNSYPTIRVTLNRNHPLYETFSQQIRNEMEQPTTKRPLATILASWWQIERSHEIDAVRLQTQDIRFDLSRAMKLPLPEIHAELD